MSETAPVETADVPESVRKLAELAEAAAKVASGPWVAESEETEGAYGKYVEYAILDGQCRRLCGTENADASFGEIHTEMGTEDDGGRQWNESSRVLMSFLAACDPATILQLIADRAARPEATATSASVEAALPFDQKEQGKRCGCGGADEWCPCQNVPDRETIRSYRAARTLPPAQEPASRSVQGAPEAVEAAIAPFVSIPPWPDPSAKCLVVQVEDGPFHFYQRDLDALRAPSAPKREASPDRADAAGVAANG